MTAKPAAEYSGICVGGADALYNVCGEYHGLKLQHQIVWAGLAAGNELVQWLAAGEVMLNGHRALADDLLRVGDIVALRGNCYQVEPAGVGKRLLLTATPAIGSEKISGPVRVHSGLHKCLTMYFRNVVRNVCHKSFNRGISFRHFFHRQDAFYRECNQYRITSLSGHKPDLARFENIRVTRFIRDPRDLLVSGYHYHKRGAEHWCDYVDPTTAEWEVVNGMVPELIPKGVSLRQYLNRVSVEEGLLAELEFRRFHFDSMRQWQPDERVLSFRYEDILGHEADVFGDIFRFYEMPWMHTQLARVYAARLSASRGSKGSTHIRNPRAGQWRQHFTPVVEQRFNELYGDLLEQYGYPTA
mgnify:CR=1 FL=1